MKATVDWIRNLDRERADKTAPLIRELDMIVRDDSKSDKHRERREREVRAQIAGVNDTYIPRIVSAANEAAAEPRRLYNEGSAWKPEHLMESNLIVEEYRNKPSRQERDQLRADIETDLRAGNPTGARIKARAAKALGLQLGPLTPQLNDADPIKRDARNSMEAIELVAKLALAEPVRELAAAGFGTVSQRIALKHLVAEAGLRPDAPFIPQMGSQPATGGANAIPEPYDPVRDEQRKEVERLRMGGWEDPADVEARYNASRESEPTDDGQHD